MTPPPRRRDEEMTDDDMLIHLDRAFDRQTERVRAMLMEHGRPDLVRDLDKKLDKIRSGIDGARATWNALSHSQRGALEFMGDGGARLEKDPSGTLFTSYGHKQGYVARFRSPTVRNLLSRELIGWATNGRKIVVTERGRFVLKHGRNQ